MSSPNISLKVNISVALEWNELSMNFGEKMDNFHKSM